MLIETNPFVRVEDEARRREGVARRINERIDRLLGGGGVPVMNTNSNSDRARNNAAAAALEANVERSSVVEMFDSPENNNTSNNVMAAHERILRSVTGMQISLGGRAGSEPY